ncbi:MAG: hypothetical protein OEZ19_08035 [Paracoccaceae bacterium]|nr:hypothetical protein [Paracoccaceae bacterium]
MTRDEMIEAMARAGNKAFGGPWWECECTAQRGIDCDCGDALLEERLDRYDDQMSREDWRFQAKAMLDALEAAGMRIVPVKALDRLLQSAAMLQQNSEECVRRHHGFDTDLHGLPGWLRETAEDIREVRAMIEDSKEE